MCAAYVHSSLADRARRVCCKPCRPLLTLQPHVVCGEQLVHSPYMQCLASMAVGLHLDQLLCRPPVPPSLRHCPPDSGSAVWCSSEWAWLDCFSTTVKAAEALARGATFPESFSVPDLEPVPKDEMSLLMVRAAQHEHSVIIPACCCLY